MSTLQERCNADLESATDNDNGGAASGGSRSGGGGDEQQSVDVIEIVGLAEINNGDDKNEEEKREPNVSECSVDIADLETGKPLHLTKTETERDCRICHLSMDATNQDSEIPFELGCSCKDDLAAAHKQCAEAWFKIKGDKTCEICGSVAENVGGVTEGEVTESWSDAAAGSHSSQSRNFWQGHRFLNFLLACMVFAFVISWLFHFNVPS